ncbi:MAG: Crp/Fnr family transcriptional regulator [Acidimicrobiales bacterium]
MAKQQSQSVPEWLAQVAFFDGFTKDELARVIELAEEVDAEADAVLCEQGRVGQDCYVIVEGDASVLVRGEYVVTLHPGSMVGEMSLVDHRPRSATVVADEPMKLLRFDTKHFQTLLAEMPEANNRVMAMLHARIPGSGRPESA